MAEASVLTELSKEQLMELLKGVVTHAIVEAKKPDEETAAKQAIEKARLIEARNNRIAQARLEAEQKAKIEANCSHTKENGRTAFAGQIHSDGLVHPVCLHCQKLGTPYRPQQETIVQSVNTPSTFSFS